MHDDDELEQATFFSFLNWEKHISTIFQEKFAYKLLHSFFLL